MPRASICFLLVLMPLMILLSESASWSQGASSWWGSSSWFDWSDHRFSGGARVFLARMGQGTVTKGGREISFSDRLYGIDSDPEPFREVWGCLYVDRLGIRIHVEEYVFRGRREDVTNDVRISELNASATRVGLDIDLIRLPYLRAGVDVDYTFTPFRFRDRSELNFVNYDADPPITVGIHARAVPFRIREIPVTIQGRARIPVPFLNQITFLNRQFEAKLTDWEVSAGLRPPVWETSLYGFSTFSAGIEGGFRAISLEMNGKGDSVIGPTEAEVRAKWQGAFIQVCVFF